MAQLDSHSSIIKGKHIYIGEPSEGQWQSDVSAIPIQTKQTFDPSCNIWQVGAKVCIFRVPNPIMICKREAYLPSSVSLGPYHHDSNHILSKMNQHKQEAVRRMVSRIKRDVGFLMREIQNLEKEIRECYEEKINCDGETLCCMMVYDACFILEFLRCASTTKNGNRHGFFSLVFQNKDFKNCIHTAILNDIMKLENQVPLIVLTTILRYEFDHPETELAALLSKTELFKGFPFDLSLSDDDVNSKQKDDVVKSKLKDDAVKSKLKEYIEKYPYYHLLHLYRMVIKDVLTPPSSESFTAARPGYMQLPSSPKDSSFISNSESIVDQRYNPSAEKLHSAGIKFQPGQVGFQWSRLSLPQITVTYETEDLLRNLIAYEECQRCSWRPEPTVISYYVRLLDNLINSEKDVSVLRESNVIKSAVGSDEFIVSMFNHLQIGFTVDPLTINRRGPIYDYENVIIQLRERCNTKWRLWIAEFWKEHCSSPWYIISSVAATLLLALTVIQTVYAII